MNKTQKVLNHLKNNGSITSIEAFSLYNATRLSAIIFSLRKRYKIDMETKYTFDEDGRKVMYGVYHLREQKN